ncbi:MAG: hypothetical protein K9L89_05710 [Kiritimatiellales bacterium]|nr:hypothetical protein [Kiritimatiellales bacterium]
MKKIRMISLSLLVAGFVTSSYAGIVTNWVTDPSFEETLLLSTEPNTNSSPWVAVETQNAAVQREDSIVNSGTNAVVFQYYNNTDTFYQNLGLTVDSNAYYVVKFALRHDEMTGTATYTNDSRISVLINTSPTVDGTYTWKASVYNVLPSAPYVWEEKTVSFSGADLADRHGQYIRLGFKNQLNASKYRVFIDDVSFGEYTNNTPIPDNLLAGWDSTISEPDHNKAGVTGWLYKNRAFALNTVNGSTDLTFGSTNAGATELLGCYEVRTATPGSNDTVAVRIINNTGAPLQLDSLNFDYSRWSDPAPQNVSLLYAYGDLNADALTLINSTSGIPVALKIGDYTDFDWSLAGLADTILAEGESATFNLVVSNATGIYSSGAFDNIAFLGQQLPNTGYIGWANGWGVDIGATTNDYDGDGLLNIYEYGLGGDPTNGLDQGTAPTFGTVNVGGTNYFGYIHPQLSDPASGLTYSLALTTDLVYPTWATNSGYIVTGTNFVGPLDFVTNVTDTVDSKKYIRLIIE